MVKNDGQNWDNVSDEIKKLYNGYGKSIIF